MADLAKVFHWTPQAMDPMSLTELMGWHDKALARLPQYDSDRT